MAKGLDCGTRVEGAVYWTVPSVHESEDGHLSQAVLQWGVELCVYFSQVSLSRKLLLHTYVGGIADGRWRLTRGE